MIKIRTGITFGFFKTKSLATFDEFSEDMRPASFGIKYDLVGVSEEDKEHIRAEIVRKELTALVSRV